MAKLNEMTRGAATGALRVAAALLALAWGTAAGAQRLHYADLAAAPAAPRLGYAPVADDEPAAQSPAQASPPATPAAESARVRELYLDQMEIAIVRGEDGYGWDLSGKIGGPRHRLYLGSIGEGTLGGSLDYLEMQAFYSPPLSADWDLQLGLRYDIRPRPNRAWATLGVQGGLGENFYVGAYSFLSHRGELAARLYGAYDLRLGESGFVLQPSAELNAFGSDMTDLGLGHGLSYGEAGLRLRYEARGDALTPYVGVEWAGSFGRTARFAREAGEETSGIVFLVGLRSWNY